MFHIGINMMRLKSSFVVLLFGFVSYSSLGFTQPEQSKVSESTVIQSLQSANLMPIPIGSLSTQDNARHQAYCKRIGANDVTNSGQVMVSSGISELAVCLRNDVRKNNAAPPESNKIFRIVANFTQQLTLIFSISHVQAWEELSPASLLMIVDGLTKIYCRQAMLEYLASQYAKLKY